jgi:hypothetical protein
MGSICKCADKRRNVRRFTGITAFIIAVAPRLTEPAAILKSAVEVRAVHIIKKALTKRSDYSLRLRADRRALLLTLAAIATCGLGLRLTHVQLFGALARSALGLYVIRFARLAYRDPDETIGAWQSFYSYLQPGSTWSRRFLRGIAVVGLFGAQPCFRQRHLTIAKAAQVQVAA